MKIIVMTNKKSLGQDQRERKKTTQKRYSKTAEAKREHQNEEEKKKYALKTSSWQRLIFDELLLNSREKKQPYTACIIFWLYVPFSYSLRITYINYRFPFVENSLFIITVESWISVCVLLACFFFHYQNTILTAVLNKKKSGTIVTVKIITD